MAVVVTGATGHIGTNLTRALIAQGRPVSALIHHNRQAIEGLDVKVISGNICDPESLCRAFDGAEVVYHLAAHISLLMDEWPSLELINVVGTRNVVEACLRCGVRRLVHFSSIHALTQEPRDVPIDELRPLVDSRHCPPYDRSKAASEQEVCRGIERGLDAIIINPTAIIGPHDYQLSHFGEVLLALALRKMPALVTGGFDWVDARDVAEGAIRAEQRAPTGAKYLLPGHWVSIPKVAALVEEITGTPAPRFVCPMWLARTGAPFVPELARITIKRPLYTSVSLRALRSNRNISHDKATRELDYQPRPFRETLVDTFKWFEENGQLPRLPVTQSTESR